MLELRSLIVITGTVKIEGGQTRRVRESDRSGTRTTVTVDHKVTPDRRAGSVIVADYLRRIRQFTILRTAYGILADPKDLPALQALLGDIGRKIAAYNAVDRTCSLSNCVLWERLAGNRLNAVVGWVRAQVDAGNDTVTQALPKLRRMRDAA